MQCSAGILSYGRPATHLENIIRSTNYKHTRVNTKAHYPYVTPQNRHTKWRPAVATNSGESTRGAKTKVV